MITAMATNTPSQPMFNFTIMASLLSGMMTVNWLLLWLLMELNLLPLTAVMMKFFLSKEMEAMIKYLIPQGLSSSLILMSGSFQLSSTASSESPLTLMLALLVKLGVVPFHSWMPSIFNNSSWWPIMLISTWQKSIPLLIMTEILTTFPNTLYFFVALNATMSSLMGMNQSNMRPIIAYSTMHHTSWMLIGSSPNKDYMLIYLWVYVFILSPIIMFNFKSNKMKSSQFNMTMMPFWDSVFTMVHMLSLGGMPPLIGFMPKLLILWNTILLEPLMAVILTSSATLTILFYSQIFFSSELNHSKSMCMTNYYSELPIFLMMSTIVALLFL